MHNDAGITHSGVISAMRAFITVSAGLIPVLAAVGQDDRPAITTRVAATTFVHVQHPTEQQQLVNLRARHTARQLAHG